MLAPHLDQSPRCTTVDEIDPSYSGTRPWQGFLDPNTNTNLSDPPPKKNACLCYKQIQRKDNPLIHHTHINTQKSVCENNNHLTLIQSPACSATPRSQKRPSGIGQHSGSISLLIFHQCVQCYICTNQRIACHKTFCLHHIDTYFGPQRHFGIHISDPETAFTARHGTAHPNTSHKVTVHITRLHTRGTLRLTE